MIRHLQGVLRHTLLRLSGPPDLARLDRVPDRIVWPLERDGVELSQRLLDLNAADPVHELGSLLGTRIWLVTGWQEARQVLSDPTSWSTDIRPYLGRRAADEVGGLGFTDPPDHTRLRRLLTPEFTRHRLRRVEESLQQIVATQLDAISERTDADGVVDLVETFAFPVPFLMICELLGLPDRDRETFRGLGQARFGVDEGGVGTFGAISSSREFLKEATARQRHEPGPGLIGQLIREHGSEITDLELAGLADGVFTGGMETSAGMLALGTGLLLQRRDLWQRLPDDAALVEPLVEELLRHLSVVQVAFPRFARSNVLVGERQVRVGDVVLVSLPAADHDAVFGTAPRELDPMRGGPAHLAFGHGLHRCVGAELGRLELRTAYPALARRFPKMQLSGDDPGYRARSLVFGVDRLPVRPNG
ncbi:cytochrome P450 [Nocardioides sp. Bht2]|uniref:cytochrome P450 n=1 Tax=Nocardioides sp. Bht2 TaxID=3392297 RepID=UPI0039B53ABA